MAATFRIASLGPELQHGCVRQDHESKADRQDEVLEALACLDQRAQRGEEIVAAA
ncbi:hypothetical protein ACFSOZ_33945 [Mesorhizobium newzealandense]|uniref:Uncharacterized protein n=1 Tax=Mesorhizobium newzealandense TaxID=1300302 RepID=A0ABW4UJZ2_9HYPH